MEIPKAEVPTLEEIRKVVNYYRFLQNSAREQLWHLGRDSLTEDYHNLGVTIDMLIRFQVLSRALQVKSPQEYWTYRSLFDMRKNEPTDTD